MNNKPHFSPGCFGSAHFFNKEDNVCAACPFAGQCEPVHQRARAQFQQFYGVKSPSRPKGDLPLKVNKIFSEQGKTKEEVKAAMTHGLNPYRVKDGFLGVICQLILQLKEVHRDKLVAALAAYRNYNINTADVYTRHALQILAYCGAITQDGKTVKLACESTAQ